MSATHPKEQDSFECFGIPAHVWELPPDSMHEERVPGANRRNWVHREMAMLGADAMLGVEALLGLYDADDSQSIASAERAASPTLRQSSSR